MTHQSNTERIVILSHQDRDKSAAQQQQNERLLELLQEFHVQRLLFLSLELIAVRGRDGGQGNQAGQ